MDNNDTTRMTVNASGTASGFATFYPYGEPGNGATSAEYEWTNQIRDSNGVDHFWRRDYASQLARWLSPDPAGLAAVSLTNPQTWNEYAYVLNDPASATDAEGLLTTTPPYQPPAAPPWAWADPEFRWFNIMNMMPTVDPEAPPPHLGPMGGGGGGPATAKAPLLTMCQQKVVGAVNRQFGVHLGAANVLPSSNPLPAGGGEVNVNLLIKSGLSGSQFNAIGPGRYAPQGVWGFLTGDGPSLHVVSGPSGLDPNVLKFARSNVGGRYTVTFTAHIDSAWADNPVGALLHFFIDVLGHDTRNPCP
jgi:RHS repeat-associated protein